MKTILHETMRPKPATWRACALLIAMAGSIQHAHGAVTVSELPPEKAFVVNGVSFGINAYTALAGAIRQQSPDANEAKVLTGLVENHLLATAFAQSRHPVQSVAMARLLEQMFPHSHLSQQNKLWQEYGMLLGQLYPVEVTAAVEQRCIHSEAIDSAALKKMLGSESSDPGKIADTTVTVAKKRDATAIVVANIHCADSETTQVTLGSVLESADEASALQLWRGETATLTRLVGSIARIRLHEGLLLKQKRLLALDLQTLWQVAKDKQTRIDYEAEAGVKFDLHHSPENVKKLMQGVTEKEIDDYYDQHKLDYQQILRVTARHITVATQSEADRVVAEIKQGLPFDEAVRKYSLAEDKNTNPPGSLGVINRTDKTLPFVKKLALILPAGEVSNPFRMLDGKTYEILWVDTREAEVLPKTDPSVRSEIRREVAGIKARNEFADSTKMAWSKATIILNQRHFNAPWVASWPMP